MTEQHSRGIFLIWQWLSLTLLMAGLAGTGFAQASGSQDPSTEGVNAAGYVIHSSTEFGYRFTDRTGSADMYDTLVNLHQGPRLLEGSLSMQSENHAGVLFDNLSISSFGWGGEPNNVLRARAEKDKWYNFQASFRRDQNFFDYDLLANPLNPPSSTPSLPVTDSPHEFATTRRMSDVDLTLLPQSNVSFRLGYSRNNMTGPSFSSIHIGTDALLYQPWNTTVNSYRLGADWRLAPRTVISYDQFFDYYKGDSDDYLSPVNAALLPGGGSVSLGLPIDTASNIPCAVPGSATSLINPGGILTNVACNAYNSYSRLQRIRTSAPTERVSLRSSYFARLELTASYAYSDADMNTPLSENFEGLESRTLTRAFTGSGTASAHRISDVVDVGATVHLSKHVRLINKFYFWAYRIPQNASFTEVDSNVSGGPPCIPPGCSLLVPLSATVPSTSNTLTQSSFNQNWKRNQTEVAWDISSKLGARIGYRYGDQRFDHFLDFTGDEDHFVVLEQTALFGVWAKPIHGLRLNFDLEHSNYDETIVRIEPRKESRYRFQTTYAPRPWVSLGGSVNILEDSNNVFLTNYAGHNRNYGVNGSLTPRPWISLDLAYNYNDFLQNATICFNDTPPLGIVLPVVTGAGSCAVYDSANPLLTDSYYVNNNHYGLAAVTVKPERRLTAKLGYSITSVDGRTPQFNILQPLGPLQYKYQQPLADFSWDLGHNLAWNVGWNYYQYGEGSFVGPTASRYFHTNNTTVSLRYAF